MKKKPTLAEATISEERGVRYLHLGTPWIQGAMRIRQPQKLELEYIQRMMAWLLLRDPEQLPDTRCLQLGLGAAAITKYCHSVLRLPTTAVEINPQVIGVCRSWFHLPEDDERLTVVQADAARFVASDDQVARFDALSVDLYDHEAASPVLDDEAFYRACWRCLDDGGVMTRQPVGRDASFERSAARISAAFGPNRVAKLEAHHRRQHHRAGLEGLSTCPSATCSPSAPRLYTPAGRCPPKNGSSSWLPFQPTATP